MKADRNGKPIKVSGNWMNESLFKVLWGHVSPVIRLQLDTSPTPTPEYMTGLKISCTWLCQVKQKIVTQKLFEIAPKTKAHCIAYGFLFKSYAGLFLVKCLICGILPHICRKNAKKRCFSITNFFEGQLWRCVILKVLITNDSNFADTLINIFTRQI